MNVDLTRSCLRLAVGNWKIGVFLFLTRCHAAAGKTCPPVGVAPRPPTELRVLLLGESPCAWSPILRYAIYNNMECPGGHTCQLDIDCDQPRDIESRSSLFSGLIGDPALTGLFLAYQPPVTLHEALLRECASVTPPHIIIIHLGISDSFYNLHLMHKSLVPADVQTMVQNVTRWGNCAWSVTFATPNPIQDTTVPRFNWPPGWPGNELLTRNQNLARGLENALRKPTSTCPTADYLKIEHKLWNQADYAVDPLHYCRDLPPTTVCNTSLQVGARLAAGANVKLKALAEHLDNKWKGSPQAQENGPKGLKIWLEGDEAWETKITYTTTAGPTSFPQQAALTAQPQAVTDSTFAGKKNDASNAIWTNAHKHGPQPQGSSNSTCNGTVNDTGSGSDGCTASMCNTGFEVQCSRMWQMVAVLGLIFVGVQFFLMAGRMLSARESGSAVSPVYAAVDEPNAPQELERQQIQLESKSSRLPGLDGLRFIGALHVLCFHLLKPACKGTLYCTLLDWGRLWVQWFFVLSGFVSAWSEMGKQRDDQPAGLKPILESLSRRLWTLYPLYLVALLVDIRAWQLVTSGWWGRYLVVVHATMLQAWLPPFATDPPNGPGWFVSCLFAFWLFAPLWIQALKHSQTYFLLVVLAGCCAYGALPGFAGSMFEYSFRAQDWYGSAVHHSVAFTPFSNYHYFVAGVAGGILVWHMGSCFQGWRWVALLTLTGSFCFTGALATADYPLLVEKGLWTLPLWLCLAFLLTDPDCPLTQLSSNLAPTAYLAYPLYILHVPLSHLVQQVKLESVAIQIPVIIMLAAAINRLVEKLLKVCKTS